MIRKTRFSTGFLGLCLLLASCGQDDMPNQENTDGALRPMTLTATLPEGMTTRTAADYDDPAAAYCYAQVLDENGNTLEGEVSQVQAMTKGSDGSYSLTLYLVPDKKYCFLFWADNVTSTAPADLKAVKYTRDGKTIAFAAKKPDVSWSQQGVSASLGHVVTRISVKTTADAALDGSSSKLTVSVPRCYTEYNVYGEAPNASAIQENFAYDAFSGTFEAGEHVGHFYVLGDGTQQNLTITYEGTAGRNSTGLSNVPLLPNYHITLQGDITNVGLAEYLIEASVDSGWNTGEEVDFPGYTVDADGNYTVTTADGLLAWNKAARNDLSINCTLTKDIDLTGKEWTPIGTSGNTYTGTFDGNGKTITGLTVKQEGTNYVGLFGYIGTGGKVMNVTLTDVEVTGRSLVGGVAGQNDGTVENCSVVGTVTGTGYTDTGGIVGTNYGTISGCKAEGTVTGGESNVGGIAGGSYLGSTIEGCYSTAAVSGDDSVGGVVGSLQNGCSLMACYSTGNVTATSTTGYAGGVVGANSQGTVTGCYHANGTVSGQAGYVGGIAGLNSSGTFTACYWGSNGQTQGIGENGTSGDQGIKQVDGTDVTWQTAVDHMNQANNNTGWIYSLTGELPTLGKD